MEQEYWDLKINGNKKKFSFFLIYLIISKLKIKLIVTFEYLPQTLAKSFTRNAINVKMN